MSLTRFFLTLNLHALKTNIKSLCCFWKFFCTAFSHGIAMYTTKNTKSFWGYTPTPLHSSHKPQADFQYAFSMAQRLWPQLYKYQPTEKLVICHTVVLKKGVTLIFILTNPFQCYLSLSVWFVCVCVCVFCLFTPFLSVLIVFHWKN